MTNNKSWLMDFQGFDGGTVLLGDDFPCKVIGAGSIRLKLGSEMTLRDVKFIPQLKRNFISVGLLDDLWYTIKAEAGTIKVSKGSLTLMKGVKRNGIYLLVGATAIGIASVVKESEEVASLWHRRLGHVSEKGLMELSSKDYSAKTRSKAWNFVRIVSSARHTE